MKLRILIPVILSAHILVMQGCKEKEVMYDLFAGTLPAIQVTEGETNEYSAARSLFLSLTDETVELDGQTFNIERSLEDDSQVVFRANFPLVAGIEVTEMVFQKSDRTLHLKLGKLGKSVSLELLDNMLRRKAAEFAEVDLKADISHLSDRQREMLGILFQVAGIMEEIYWEQVFPDRDAALSTMLNEDAVRFFKINYGPWERLNGNLPYLPGYGPKPAGSGFYPHDMTVEEFEELDDDAK